MVKRNVQKRNDYFHEAEDSFRNKYSFSWRVNLTPLIEPTRLITVSTKALLLHPALSHCYLAALDIELLGISTTVWTSIWGRRCSVRIQIGTPAILTDVFRGFPQSLQANVGTEYRSGHDGPFQNLFRFTTHLPPLRTDANDGSIE
jgi:hypothetical protein